MPYGWASRAVAPFCAAYSGDAAIKSAPPHP
jgi:hypothetical protein